MVTGSVIARPDDQVLRVILGIKEKPRKPRRRRKTSKDKTRPSGDPERMPVWLL